MDNDLIRRGDAMKLIGFWGGAHGLAALSKVRQIPAVDAEEVVRCRECVNWRRYDDSPADCDMNMMRMEPDGFCSWGQRREDGDA